jgi:integrase/recombinase XerD
LGYVRLVMDNFKFYLINKDLSPRTIKRHLWYVRYILVHAPNFTFEEIDKFLLQKKEGGCKNVYLNHLVPSIRTYAEFKGLKGYKEHYKYHKEEVYIKATMSDEEIDSFLNLPCPAHKVTRDWYKYTVFFSIMAYCGLRPSEVASLKVEDIDFGQKSIYITQGKTAGSVGSVPMPPNLQPLLKDYVETIKQGLLFAPRNGGKSNFGIITACIWNNAFHRRLKILGIKRKNLTTYSLRHSYCTALLSNEVNVFDAKRLMRHTDLKTTEHYYHYTIENLRRAQAKHPLIRRGTDPNLILQTLVQLIKTFKIETDNRFEYSLEEGSGGIKFIVKIKSPSS